jgi:hypothetical protein
LYETRHLEEMMKTTFKYGVSAIALLAAIALAQAQTSERQGGGASGSEHSISGRGGESGKSAQGERGGQGGAASHAEHGQSGGSSQHQGRSAEQGDHSGYQKGQGNSATEHEQRGAQKGRTAEERGEGGASRELSAEHNRNQEHGQQAERNRIQEHGQEQERNRAENRAERERTGQAERSEQGKSERNARMERENRGMQSEETRGRETELGGARGNEDVGRARGESNRFASISREQKTRIHGILVRDTAIHRYHRADVDFPVQVGTRIPNTIEFYDPPAQVVQIDPVFQGYKIVVLDDVILVIDPATREIIDVIRA